LPPAFIGRLGSWSIISSIVTDCATAGLDKTSIGS
jgi:hypothetical protein